MLEVLAHLLRLASHHVLLVMIETKGAILAHHLLLMRELLPLIQVLVSVSLHPWRHRCDSSLVVELVILRRDSHDDCAIWSHGFVDNL